MKANDILQKMEELNQFVQDAEMSVRDGNLVDIKRLDREVALLCSKAVALKPDEARDLQPVMAEMIGNLERLGASFKELRDDLKKPR